MLSIDDTYPFAIAVDANFQHESTIEEDSTPAECVSTATTSSGQQIDAAASTAAELVEDDGNAQVSAVAAKMPFTLSGVELQITRGTGGLIKRADIRQSCLRCRQSRCRQEHTSQWSDRRD